MAARDPPFRPGPGAPAADPRPDRWIVYVDMDAYFVSCEIRDRPELADRPVIVGREPTGPTSRGVVLSASYPARRSGVHSAMPSVAAARRCPEAIWIPPDFEKYERIASEIRDYLGRWSDRVVPMSIDEAALEATGSGPATIRAWAEELRAGVAETLRLPCSVGAHPSAIVAKIACDRAKPAGVCVVSPAETATFLAPLPVRVVPGIGPKTAERLAAVGVSRIGDLARVPPESVRAILGRATRPLIRLARGSPDREWSELPVPRGPRQRSRDRTFEEDRRDAPRILAELDGMARALADELARERLRYQSLSVRIRWEEFRQEQRGRRLPAAQEGPEPLRGIAQRLAREMLDRERAGADRAVRRISLSVSDLTERRDRRVALEQFGDGPATLPPPPEEPPDDPRPEPSRRSPPRGPP